MRMAKTFWFMENDISMFLSVYPEPIKTPLAMYPHPPFLLYRTNSSREV